MRLFCFFIILLVVVAGCGRDGAPAAPTRPQDEVRIAALSPAVAVIMSDLDVADRVVARHGWDLALDRELPVGGDQAGLDYEMLLRVNPTHILLEWGARPIPVRLEQLAQQQNWTVHNYRLLTLEEIEQAARDLHAKFGAGGADSSWEETDLAKRWRESLREREGLHRAGRVLVLYSTRPPGALGPGSAHQQVLEAIGGLPALTEGNPYITLDAEDVLRMAPDGIILIRPRGRDAPAAHASADEVRQQLGRVGMLDVPAVRLGRLALIDHPLGQLPSTSLTEIADEMAAILEVWARE